MNCMKLGLGLVLLTAMTAQSVSAQPPPGFGVFKHAKKFAYHPSGRDHTDILGPGHPAFNHDDEFATGLDGLKFRTAVRTDIYDETAGFDEVLVTEVLYEITVRDKEDKLVLDPPTGTQGQPGEPGELVIVDYKVTLLDSEWAPHELYLEEEWDWEDESSAPAIEEILEDWGDLPQSNFGYLYHRVQTVGFTPPITDHPEYQPPHFCDYAERQHNGIWLYDEDDDEDGDGCVDTPANNALVLPGASYKGTYVFRYIGSCPVEPSIQITSNVNLTENVNGVRLHWDIRKQFLDAAPFYKGSSYDNGDDHPVTAIAPDKYPFFDGETGMFENITSYEKGLNGIVIDIRNQVCGNGDATPEDFVFKTGDDNTPGDWQPVTTAPIVRTEQGGGVDGTDRIWLFWDDHVIEDTWLQVQMPGVETESGKDATFYFGNLVGETGNGPQNPNVVDVGVFDLLKFRNDYGSKVPADIESVSDFDRSGGLLNVFDLLLFRKSYLNSIPRITPQPN